MTLDFVSVCRPSARRLDLDAVDIAPQATLFGATATRWRFAAD
jgi:hypothetical protein